MVEGPSTEMLNRLKNRLEKFKRKDLIKSTQFKVLKKQEDPEKDSK